MQNSDLSDKFVYQILKLMIIFFAYFFFVLALESIRWNFEKYSANDSQIIFYKELPCTKLRSHISVLNIPQNK